MVRADVRVREAALSEIEAVQAVLQAANAEFATIFPPAFFQSFMANTLQVRSRLADSHLLVAELGEEIVGTITFYPDASKEGWNWPAHWSGIRAAAVVPWARGMGIGRQLVAACCEMGRSHGTGTICLHTSTMMAAAVAMYERLGFQRCADYDLALDELMPFEHSGPPLTAIAYVKPL